jgi:arylsulfatase A-like enzyme
MTPTPPLLDRRSFVGGLAGAAAALALPAGLASCARPLRAARPNIVLIMCDDLGYGDVGFTGATAYATPHIDRIAHEGAVLRQAYSAAPVCSPTRVALMTGRYPAREEVGLHEPLTRHPTGLPAEPPTLPRLLKNAGYDTALVGKWHLGVAPEYHPLRHGFDEFYGFLGAAADYVSMRDTEYRETLFHDGETPVQPEGYLTDVLTARAERIVGAERARPLFLSLQYNAPHWPWQAPGDPAHADTLDFKSGGSPGTYAAMMRSLDDGVGRVLAALEAREIARETLLIFTSDNGGERFSHMGPFSHAKMSVGEGGIRVATAVRWPEVIPAGTVSDQVAITMDWTATLLSLAGSTSPRPLDGIDLLPALFSRTTRARELCWRVSQRRQQKAIRSGDLKLVVDEAGEHLHDLVADPGEREDLLARMPVEAARLREALAAWEGEMLPPAPLEDRFR